MKEQLTIKEIKDLIRHPYAWPGGYEVIFIANDGEIICHKCARENFKEILWSTKNRVNDGWRIVGYGTIGNDMDYPSEENPVICAHCNRDFAEDYK